MEPAERRLGTLKKYIGQADIYFKHKGKKPLTEAGQILLTAAKDYLRTNPKERLQYLAAGTAEIPQGAGYGAIRSGAAG